MATDFAKFTTKTKGSSSKGKPFQELLFLMRDWVNPYEFAYGLEGGKKYIEGILLQESQTPALKSVREFINCSFETISCFLLPHPGSKIFTPKYDGRWSELDLEFKKQMSDLIEWFLKPESLHPKKIFGVDQTSSSFHTFATSFLKAFQSDDVPKVKSLYETTVERQMAMNVEESLNLFKSNIAKYEKLTSPDSLEQLANGMKQEKANVIDIYLDKPKLGSQMDEENYLEKLKNDIESFYANWKKDPIAKFEKLVKFEEDKKKRDSLDCYKSRMEKYDTEESPDLIERMVTEHDRAKLAAVTLFESKTVWAAQLFQQTYIEQLENEIDTFNIQQTKNTKYRFIKLVQDKQNAKVEASLIRYKSSLETYKDVASSNYLETIKNGHQDAKSSVITLFRTTLKWGDEDDIYIAKLQEQIKLFYNDYERQAVEKHTIYVDSEIEKTVNDIFKGNQDAAKDRIMRLNTIDAVIKKAYSKEQVSYLLKVIEIMPDTSLMSQGYKALFGIMRSKDHLISTQAYLFAFSMKKSMERYPALNGCQMIKNELPLIVRAIIWNEVVFIKNTNYNEYLYATDDSTVGDKDRRCVFTWDRKRIIKGRWRFETPDGVEFYIKDVYHNEYMYAATGGMSYDSDRRSVYTWKDGIRDYDAIWHILPISSETIELKNTVYNEWMFASGFSYDGEGDRRYVFTWRPKNREEKGVWKIEQ